MINYDLEDRRYSELYSRGYGSGPVGALLAWVQQSGIELVGKNIIDCGCGNAALLTRGPQFNKYVGIDISSYQVGKLKQSPQKCEAAEFIHGSIDKLPFDDGTFDIAWCSDVLEHIEETSVDAVLKEICRVASIAVLSICTRASVILDSEGGNLHLTVKESEWWKCKITTYGNILKETALLGDNLSLIIDSQFQKKLCVYS